MRMLCPAPFAALIAALAFSLPVAFAAEDPVPPTPGENGQPSPPAPTLGVVIDDGNFDQGGLSVKTVKAGSTAAALGIQTGDRLKIINGRTIESVTSLQQVMQATKIGAPISAQVTRNGEIKTLSGTVLEPPKINDVSKGVRDLREQVAGLRDAMPQKQDLTLAEVVQKLQEIEDKLPEAVAKFKQQYPNGEFNIKFQVEIISDKNAKNPVNLMDQGAAPEGAVKP
jgi:membrane-associated protease RseP (regulator of RpoE activity)